MARCMCIYNDKVHPECERENATVRLCLGGHLISEMCKPCALDWRDKNSGMEIIDVSEQEEDR